MLMALLLTAGTAFSQTNNISTNSPTTNTSASVMAQRAEQIRAACINGRRQICGRIVQISTNGLVVESGYTSLLRPPLNQSWVARSNVSVTRDPGAVEGRTPGAPCIGTVLLSDYPKKPAVKLYDYVIIQGYPAGEYDYVPVSPVHKTIRRFSGSLSRAVQRNLQTGETK